MSGVEIRVRANAKQAQNEIRKTGNSLKGLETQAANITKTFQRMAVGLTAVFAGAGLTKGINSAADAMIGLNNRVKLVTKDAKTTQKTINDLFDIAARSGGSIDAAAETFNRFGLALRGSGKSVDQLLTVTEAVQKAAIISGSGAESAKAAIVQLGQGLASGQLRGQELNSVLEQMPRLAQAIAEGMDIPFGKLRENAAEGKITAESVFKALIDGAEKIDAEFATLQFTTADLATVMQNELTRAISEFDKVAGFSDAFKRKILSLTTAFRFIGQNIEKWGLQTQLVFLLVESQAKDFFQGFKDLFSEQFDASAFANGIIDSFVNAFTAGKARVRNAFLDIFGETSYDEFGDEVKIAPKFEFSTAGIFKGMETAIAVFTTFKNNVIKIFEALHARLFGNSLYTGMFQDAHMEPGQTISFGTNLSGIFNKATGYFTQFKESVVKVMVNLHKEATEQWANLVAYFNETRADPTILDADIKTTYENTVAGFETKWKEFTDYVGITKPKPTFTETFTSTWDTAILGMESSWSGFLETVGATPPVDDSFSGQLKAGFNASITKMGETYDNFVAEISNEKKSDYPTFDTIKENFTKVMDSVKTSFSTVAALVKETPIVVGASVAFTSAANNYEEILSSIEDFFSENNDTLAAAVSVGVAAVFNKGIRGAVFKFGGYAAFFTGIGALGNSPAFLESVKAAGRGWGEAFASIVSGEGDIIANITAGLVSVFEAVGAGFIDGLFGEDFRSDLADNLAAIIAGVLTGLLVAPSITKASLKLGLSISKRIFAAFLLTSVGASLAEKLSFALLDMRTHPKVTSATKKLGGALQKALVIGLVTGLAVALAAAVKGAVGGSIDAVARAFTGENAVEQDNSRAVEAVNTSGAQVAGRITGGIIDLKNLTDANLDAVAKALNETVESKLDFGQGLDIFRGISSLERAIRDVNKEFEARGDDSKVISTQRFATGGYVSGAGTGTSDDIPAMLSNGEYVIKAAAVNKLGKNKLDLLNQGILPKFATGGLVGRAQQEIKDSFSRGDVGLSMEIISVVEKLGKLEEVTAGLTEEMKKEVAAVVAGNEDEERTEAIADLKSSFNSTLASGISQVLHGGDWKDVLGSLLDTVTSSIIDNFASGLAEGITKDIDFGSMFDGIGNIFSSGSAVGGGSGIGSLLSMGMGFLGFSQGGVVPNIPGSQAGKDSVPAMLMPGEVVLSKNDMRNMNNNQGGSTQSFSINVQGDVSRQTRKEIVKMMPQISNGVNAQNKERGAR